MRADRDTGTLILRTVIGGEVKANYSKDILRNKNRMQAEERAE